MSQANNFGTIRLRFLHITSATLFVSDFVPVKDLLLIGIWIVTALVSTNSNHHKATLPQLHMSLALTSTRHNLIYMTVMCLLHKGGQPMLPNGLKLIVASVSYSCMLHCFD